MRPYEHYQLSPWRKWRHYRIFPFKVLCHLTLVATSSWAIVSRDMIWTNYTVGSYSNFCFFFFPGQCVEDGTCSTQRLGDVCYLSSSSDVMDGLSSAVANYYNITSTSLAAYSFVRTAGGGIKPPVLRVLDRGGKGSAYVIHPNGNLAPLDTVRGSHMSQVQHQIELQSLQKLEFEVELRDSFSDDLQSLVHVWHVVVAYELDGTTFKVTREASLSNQSSGSSNTNREAILHLQICNIILALIYLAVLVRDLLTSCWLLKRACHRRLRRTRNLDQTAVSLRQPYSEFRSESPASNESAVAGVGCPAVQADYLIGGDAGADGASLTKPFIPGSQAETRCGADSTRNDKTGTFTAIGATCASGGTYKPDMIYDTPIPDQNGGSNYSSEEDNPPDVVALPNPSVWALVRFINPWTMPMAGASCLVIASNLQAMQNISEYRPFRWRLVDGLGNALLWLGLLGYLQFNYRLYTLALIIFKSMPLMARVLLSVAPFFIGITLLGYTMFAADVEVFGTFDLTLNTHFAFMNGDVLLDTYRATTAKFGWLAAVYLTLFFCLFTYVVLNISLVVVEYVLEQIGGFFAAVTMEKTVQLHRSGSIKVPESASCRIREEEINGITELDVSADILSNHASSEHYHMIPAHEAPPLWAALHAGGLRKQIEYSAPTHERFFLELLLLPEMAAGLEGNQ